MNQKTLNKLEPERRLIEVKAVGDEKKMTIEGYAIMFDKSATHDYGWRKFTETIQKGSLTKTDMKDVPLRYNYNDNVLVIARTRNKSLRLLVDEKGLKIEAELLDTQSNRDGYMTLNQINEMFGVPPFEGGNVRLQSLNYADSDIVNTYQLNNKDGDTDEPKDPE